MGVRVSTVDVLISRLKSPGGLIPGRADSSCGQGPPTGRVRAQCLPTEGLMTVPCRCAVPWGCSQVSPHKHLCFAPIPPAWLLCPPPACCDTLSLGYGPAPIGVPGHCPARRSHKQRSNCSHSQTSPGMAMETPLGPGRETQREARGSLGGSLAHTSPQHFPSRPSRLVVCPQLPSPRC